MIIRCVVFSVFAVVFLCWPNRANPQNKKHGAPTFVVWKFDEGDLC